MVRLLRKGMTFSVIMLTWDEISGQKVVATAATREEAELKVNQLSEQFPYAYFDYEKD